MELRQLCIGLLQSLGASGNACSSFPPCPPCLPSPASCCLLPALGGQRAGGHWLLLSSEDSLSPAQLQLGSKLFLCFRESRGLGRGRGRGRRRTEVLPGWSGSGPQIRGPSRPSDSVGLGPGVQLCLIADCKPQTQEPSRRRNRIYRNIAPDASPKCRRGLHNVHCAQGWRLRSPPSSRQERAWLTPEGAHCAGDTETPPCSPHPLHLGMCYSFHCQCFSSLLFILSTPSHLLQEGFLSLWRCVWLWGGKKQECPCPPRHRVQSPVLEPPDWPFPSTAWATVFGALFVPTGTPGG